MFGRILAPLDGSTLAAGVLPHLTTLLHSGGEAVLLRVVEHDRDSPLVDPFEWRVRRDVAQVYLDEVARRLHEEADVPAATLVEEGCAAERILAIARESECPLIAVSSHGAGGLNAWNINSVAFKVAQRSGASLLVVRGYRQGEETPVTPTAYRRILVPLDGSLRAEHVLPAADALAVRLGATLVLSHVVQRPRFIQRLGTGELGPALAQAVEVGVSQGEAYLDDLARGLQAAAAVRVLSDHDPAAALHQVVAEEEIDLVLLSAHGHSGQRYWPLGSLATSFMLYGSTALLVLQDIPWDDLVPSQAELSATSAPSPAHRSAGGSLPGQVQPVASA